MLISKLLTDNRICAADVANERMAVRERATSVAKMYMGRAEKLQQDWQQHHADGNAGIAKRDTAQAELGVKIEGYFSVAAAVSSYRRLHCSAKPSGIATCQSCMCVLFVLS